MSWEVQANVTISVHLTLVKAGLVSQVTDADNAFGIADRFFVAQSPTPHDGFKASPSRVVAIRDGTLPAREARQMLRIPRATFFRADEVPKQIFVFVKPHAHHAVQIKILLNARGGQRTEGRATRREDVRSAPVK
jgi:hypothetical protein